MARRGLPQFGIESVLPTVVFYAAWRLAGLGAGVASATLVSLALAGWQARLQRGGALALVTAAFVLIQGAVGLAAHSATVYLAQPVVLSACWGLVYLGSVVAGRPLVGVLASVWYPFPPEFRASRPYRREFAMQSIVFGVFCFVRAALRLFVLLEAGVGGFILISTVTGTPIIFALVFWAIWHARRTFTRLDAVPVL
jgi:Protein of unknown function (DUF3159)